MSEKNLADFVISIIKDMAATGDKEYKDLQVKLTNCFKNYTTSTHKKCSKIKTLLYRDKPVSLELHYVATDLANSTEVISGTEALHHFKNNKRNIVTGTAGSGKSVLLRKLALDMINTPVGLIPCLIELRQLTSRNTQVGIIEHLLSEIKNHDESITEDQLHKALKLGKLFLLLDGLDEIDHEKRDIYERELLEISSKYPITPIVLSSRPDEKIESLQEFHVYHATGLTKEQAITLISKIDYDPKTKSSFIEHLDSGLYETHDEFASSPLLLTMMLLTYEQLAEIPEKIHIFYEQAFDTLYHKHDALKDLYKRKSYSNLPIDEFKRIFAAFCITTYCDRKFSFSYEAAIEYIKTSLSIAGNDSTSPASFFNDLQKSVCIIQQDGSTYTFVHRSFQEYFAAVFIAQSEDVDIRAALDLIVVDFHIDSVVSIAFELNKEKLEKLWILPKARELTGLLGDCLSKNDPCSALGVLFSSVAIKENEFIYSLSSDLSNGFFLSFTRRAYKHVSGIVWPQNISRPRDARQKVRALKKIMRTGRASIALQDIPKDFSHMWEFKDYSQKIYEHFKAVAECIEKNQNKRSEELKKIFLSRRN